MSPSRLCQTLLPKKHHSLCCLPELCALRRKIRQCVDVLLQISKLGIRAQGTDVVRDHPFGAKPEQIMCATRFKTRARQAFTAKRLASNLGTNLVAIDVEVADFAMTLDIVDMAGDTAMYAQR